MVQLAHADSHLRGRDLPAGPPGGPAQGRPSQQGGRDGRRHAGRRQHIFLRYCDMTQWKHENVPHHAYATGLQTQVRFKSTNKCAIYYLTTVQPLNSRATTGLFTVAPATNTASSSTLCRGCEVKVKQLLPRKQNQ